MQAFPPSSRYHRVEVVTTELPDGREVAHLRRRLCPDPLALAQIGEHMVVEGDRLDNVTARHLGAPEQFWRLCDANGVLQPCELEAVGRTIRLTLPEGIPGA